MSDFHADWTSLSDCFGDPATSYEDRRLMSYAFVKAHHATIQQNAEDVKEWEEFGRQIEKRLRHNDLGLVGGYPEMIDALLEKAMRLRALESAVPAVWANKVELQDQITRKPKPGCVYCIDAADHQTGLFTEPLFTHPPAQPAQEQPGWKVPDGLCVRNPAPNAAAAGMPSTTHLVYLSGELSAPTPPKEK